jgi:uracil-DNA glycosylase family 4
VKRAQSASLQVNCPPDGNPNAEIVVIAEAPGESEARMRVPLVGSSGRLLWDILRKYGIDRRNCWVTNVIKRQLTYHKNTDKSDLTKAELSQWQQLLRWELSQLPSVRYILVLGSPALAAVTNYERSGIDAWRGTAELRLIPQYVGSGPDGAEPAATSLAATRQVWCVYSYNPANIMRRPDIEPIFRQDMWKLDQVMKGLNKTYSITPIINPTPDEALSWLDKMQDEKLPVSFDIETMGGETACVGFTNDPHTGMCVNWRDATKNLWPLSDEVRVRLRMQQLLNDPTVQLVAQNGNFDSYWLWYKDRISVRKVWFDTMLAHHTLYPGFPHSLAFLTSQYTWHPYYKDEGKDWREGGHIDTFWEYNVKDICLTLAVQRSLLKEIEAARMQDFFFNHVMRLQPHLTRMTVSGVKCDFVAKEVFKERVTIEANVALANLYAAIAVATGDAEFRPNPRSPLQMRELYFRRLGLVGRGVSVDDENRKRMLDHANTSDAARAVLRAHDDYAKAEKQRNTYAEMAVDEDDRIRCEYKQTGVQNAPGRLSSAAVLWGTGMNLQNQTEASKTMFVTDLSVILPWWETLP